MLTEDFATGDSPLHCLDPRVKIVFAALFSVIVAVADRHACLALAGSATLFLCFLARLSLKKVFLRLLAVNTFILFLWVLLPFTYGGEALFYIGPLPVSREGVFHALLITVKSNTIVLFLIALLATTPIMTLGHALGHLKFPDKLIHLFFFTFRYIQVIHLEYQRLRNAMRVRGFEPRTNIHTYRSFAYLIGMLLISSLDRADRIRKAMLCRGFHGKFYILSHFELQRSDIVMLALLMMLISAMAVLQWLSLK